MNTVKSNKARKLWITKDTVPLSSCASPSHQEMLVISLLQQMNRSSSLHGSWDLGKTFGFEQNSVSAFFLYVGF